MPEPLDSTGFVPPPYPYDRLDRLMPLAAAFEGGAVDLSIGTPIDPAPPAVVAAFATPGPERGYPPSIGTVALREAVARWIERRFGVAVPIAAIGATIGSKEFVGTLPQWLHLRSPGSRHRAVPGGVVPDLRDGGDPRLVPAGGRADDRRPAASTWRRSTRPTRPGRCACGSTARPTRPAPSTTSAPPRRGAGPTTCRCSPTSATSSTRGTGRAAASSSTASTASSPCTRCRSAPTSPAAGSASTPVTPSSCTTSRRCASTSG